MLSNSVSNEQAAKAFLPPPGFTAPFPLPSFHLPHQQQQNNKMIKNHHHHHQQSSKYGSNRVVSNNDGAEYIDISEFEKFIDVLQEAAGEFNFHV